MPVTHKQMTEPDIEIIEPPEAAAILVPQIRALEAEGWILIDRTDYTARLTRDRINLDLRVDLLGELTMTEKPLTHTQESGQLVALVMLVALITMLLMLVSVLGILD